MIGNWWTKVFAMVLFALFGSMMTPACKLDAGSGGAGGDNCTADEGSGGAGGDGEVPAAGCTPSRTCTDLFDACQDKGKPCTRIIEGKSTLCALCHRDCVDKNPYRTKECYKCGFDDL